MFEPTGTYAPATTRYDAMLYKRCGASGLKLPAISLGFWHNFGDITPYDQMKALVLTAFDHGITHFDLANNYGPEPGAAEKNAGRLIRQYLAAHRDELVISTKAGSNDYNAIDPNFTLDASGQPYLVFGSWFSGIKIVKLDKSTMKPTGSVSTIAKRSGGIEGPTIFYRDGYYYLFVSIDKCCAGTSSTYKTAYGRATKITGPYVDKNGNKMTDGYSSVLDAGNARWVGPGGQDIYRENGYSIIARHAYDASANGAPKLLISDLKFSGGWPTY